MTNSGGIHVTPSAFLAAMFMSLFVIYGFDTASTLAVTAVLNPASIELTHGSGSFPLCLAPVNDWFVVPPSGGFGENRLKAELRT